MNYLLAAIIAVIVFVIAFQIRKYNDKKIVKYLSLSAIAIALGFLIVDFSINHNEKVAVIILIGVVSMFKQLYRGLNNLLR